MTEEEKLDWEDIFYHAAAGLLIGAIAGLLKDFSVPIEISGTKITLPIGWSIVCLNSVGWFVREYFQKDNKERLYKHKQVIYEYSFPAVSGWIGFAVSATVVERFLL